MSIQVSHSLTCNTVASASIETTSISADTSRIGDKVELRFYNGRLYIYTVNGDAIGLVGAEVAFDALPSSYHVAQMGANGSLTATVIESELSLAGISVSDFTQEVQDEFTAGILSALSFDAIVEVLSVSEGSAVVLYQVIPASSATESDLTTATATLSDAAAITTALTSSSVLSTATPTVTVAPKTVTASVPSKIVSLALQLPQSRAGATTLVSDFDEDYSYDFTGTPYDDLAGRWFFSDGLTRLSEDSDGAVYIVNSRETTIRVIKLFQGTHTVVKELSDANFTQPSTSLGALQNWDNGKVWVVGSKLYIYHGYTKKGLIEFANLTVGDNTHTVQHLGFSGCPHAMSNDAFYYTVLNSGNSHPTSHLKKKLLSDFSTEISVCTLDSNRHIYKIDSDPAGNVYVMSVDSLNDDEAWFYKITAGSSVAELLNKDGQVVTTLQYPVDNNTKKWKHSEYGGLGLWYDSGCLYFTDHSSGTILTDSGVSTYSPGDVFHFRKIDIETGDVSTVLELPRYDSFLQTSSWDGYHTANSALWYFKNEKLYAFSDWGTTKTFKQMKMSTLTDPSVTANSVGSYTSFEIKINDGTERQVVSGTTNVISSTFAPALSFYELTARLMGPTANVLNEWVINVPSVSKINSVIAGTNPAQPSSLFTWKKPSGDTWSKGTVTGETYTRHGLAASAWGHDAVGNIYCITSMTNQPILYRFKEDGGDNLEKIHHFTTAHYDTCYGISAGGSKLSRDNTFCNQMQFRDGKLYALVGGTDGGGWGIIRFDDIETRTTASPAPDPTVIFTYQGRIPSFAVSNNYIYYWGSPSDSAGTNNWKYLRRRNLDGTGETTVGDFGGQSNMNWIKGIESDGDNIYVLVVKNSGTQWWVGNNESNKVYKFSESDVGLSQTQTFAKEWHNYSFVFSNGSTNGMESAGMANGSHHRIFRYYDSKLYFLTDWGSTSGTAAGTADHFDIVTLDTTQETPTESTLLAAVDGVNGKNTSEYSKGTMNMVIVNDYIYFNSAPDVSDCLAGHWIPPSGHGGIDAYALSGKFMRMSTGIPTTVNATTVGPGTMQYSVDGTTWRDYETGGFLPPVGAYDIQLRMALDYQGSVTNTLANDPNNPVTNNDHPTLYHQNPTVSDRPGIAIYVGTQHVGFGGSTDTFTLFHRDASLEADLVPGLQFTLSGVTGPNADFWNGTYTVKSNDGAYQGNYRFSFDHPNISGYTWLGGVTAGPDGSGTATVRNPGVVVSFSTSGTVTHYSTPIVKSIG